MEALNASSEIKELGCGRTYYMIADKSAEEPFLVLTPINNRAKHEIGVKQPTFQLDVFDKDRYRAVEKADSLCTLLFHNSFTVQKYFLTGLYAERQMALQVEDGGWKVPVDIRLICKEIN